MELINHYEFVKNKSASVSDIDFTVISTREPCRSGKATISFVCDRDRRFSHFSSLKNSRKWCRLTPNPHSGPPHSAFRCGTITV